MYIALKQELKDASSDILIYLSIIESKLDYYKDFIEELKNDGFHYYIFIKNNENVKNTFLVDQSINMAMKADIGILCLDDDTFENEDIYKTTMYEGGILIKNKLVLLNGGLNSDNLHKFSECPIRDVQLSNNKQVLDSIKKYIALPRNLFKDELLNTYSQKRIFYIKFVVMLDVRYNTLLDIYNRIKEIREDFEFEDTLRALEDGITTGTTLFHFGVKENLDSINFWPYREEMSRLDLDFPVRHMFNGVKVYKKKFEDENEMEDVVATIKMEFVVPNNLILGVSFLPFFELTGNEIVVKDIRSLLMNDGIKKENIKRVIKDDKLRVYYPINAEDGRYMRESIDELKEDYGDSINYFFPK